MHDYLECINKDIKEMTTMEPTPQRVEYLHHLLEVRKHLMEMGEEDAEDAGEAVFRQAIPATPMIK